MAEENKNQDTPQMSGSGSNNSQDGNRGDGTFAEHNYGTKADGGNTANYDKDGNRDVNDAGGRLDDGQAHDDRNGGGDILGRQGGGYGERTQMLGKTPNEHQGQSKHDAESDKDTGYGTHAGGLGDSHSGFKGNHNGNDGTGGGRSSGHAGHGGDPDDQNYSPGAKGGRDDNGDPNVAGRGSRNSQ
ncbi:MULTISPECIES: hypothetical protein [Rufibacter]|uniref:Uncharacterized protein n=1 Tax=Rufibacter quisquiliarum TaxID=1549639 RepID=A0A839GQ53_9BACT|nr:MULTISPECIES: hypothetical protein [Rufibacter]MBA9078919.1 hypothetical protein [Rufibacter quisquiliarum]